VSLFHLIHLLQCNHGSETNQQILNNEELIFRAFLNIEMRIKLTLKNYCIHTAAKKYYERAIVQYFKKKQSDRTYLEKEIDNLKYFLENVNISHIRSSYPELSGKSRLDVILIIEDQTKMWQIQFLGQIVDVIWK